MPTISSFQLSSDFDQLYELYIVILFLHARE